MSATTNSENSIAKTASARAEFERLQQELKQLRSRIQRNTRLTMIVTLALLVLVVGYFYYAAHLWAEVTQPDKLVDLADQKIKETLPEMRDSLEKRIVKDAPSWAEGLSKQALESVPKARKRFEEYVLEQMNTSIEHARMVSTEQFQKFVASHRSQFDKHMDDLAKDPKIAEQSFDELIADLEKDQAVNLKVDMGELLKTFKECNEHWRYLLIGKNLDDESRLERRTWMLARRLQMSIEDSPGAGESQKIAIPKAAEKADKAKAKAK